MKRNNNNLKLHKRPLLFLVLFISAAALLLLAALNSPDTDPDPSSSSGVLTPPPPRLAYMISGSRGDSGRVKRLLRAVFHPRNTYIVHLDLLAPDSDRLGLAEFVNSDDVLSEFGNVMVVGRPDLVTPKGPTVVAATLHGVAILLKKGRHWDWFLNLCASDYPLIPQDDFLHILSYLPRDLNFMEHTSNIGWKENQIGRPIVIDSGLYHSKKSGIFWAKERRSMPASFKLFMGSSWVMLTKPFLEFCVWGWDNLPRTLLLYYTNVLSSTEGYFHTVACNHKDYQNTTVNHDLRYTKWEDSPALSNQAPVPLTLRHFNDMVMSGAPFAHNFAKDDPVLDKIDKELLKRPRGFVTPGGWCVGKKSNSVQDACSVRGNPNAVKPSLNSKRLEKFIVKLLDPENFRAKQCK